LRTDRRGRSGGTNRPKGPGGRGQGGQPPGRPGKRSPEGGPRPGGGAGEGGRPVKDPGQGAKEGRPPGRPGEPASEGRPRPDRSLGARAPEGQRRGAKGYTERMGAAPRPIQVPSGLEMISGRNAVREALRAGRRVRRLFVVQDQKRDELVEEVVGRARALRVPIEEVDGRQLELVAPEHRGLAAAVAPFQYADWRQIIDRLRRAKERPTVLVLDTLQDPQNMATLIRTAEATGAGAVVLPKRRSAQVTPAVVRSSSGAVEHVAVAQVPNLVRALEELKEIGYWVAGIDMEGGQLHWELDMSGPTALVLGGEDHGLGQLLKQKCDFLVRLPMVGQVNSLNAAVAGSIVLYEAARQRSLKPRGAGE
jgi:23S rRNA (guanosine2251-2'-O)-methyltransferase